MPRFPFRAVMLPLLLAGLAGCDMLGLPNPAKEAAQLEAEAKAVGAACRHSGRSLEDCYALYPDQSRAQVFAGWKEMQDYMATGNLTAVPPTIDREPPKSGAEEADQEEEDPQPKKSSKRRTPSTNEGENGDRHSKADEAGEKHAKAPER